MSPLFVNINIKLLLIAVVRIYCCIPKMLKKNWINRRCVIIFIIGSFSIGGGGKRPNPSGYAYGLMITVQVYPRINLNIYCNRNTKL